MYRPPFPFETDYLSHMSEDELMDLFRELEADDFWDTEQKVQELVEGCLERCRSANVDFTSFPYTATPYITCSFGTAPPTHMAVSMRSLSVRMPPWMSDTQLRFFIEAQIREQMDPSYDPTDR
jgi:hypothetical protein